MVEEKFELLPFTKLKTSEGYIIISNENGTWMHVDSNILKRIENKNFDENIALRLFSRGFLKINDVSRVIDGGSKYNFEPNFIEVDLTQQCTLRCKYCYASAGDGEKMSDDVLERVGDVLIELPVNMLCLQPSGGEPLLEWSRFKRLLDRVKNEREDLEIRINLETNGTEIDYQMAKELFEYGVNVGISIDGRPEEHNITRPYPNDKPSYDDVVKGINALYDAGYEKISSITILNKINVKDPEGLVKHLVIDLGLTYPRFNPLLLKGRAIQNKELALTTDEFLKAKKRIFLSMVKLKKEGYLQTIPDDYFINVTTMYRKNLCLSRGCSGGFRILSISVEGDIYPCVRLMSPEFCLGNVKTSNLKDAYENFIRKFPSRNAETFEDCKTCSWKAFCNAGCPGESLHTYGSIMYKTPLCDFVREYYNFMIYYITDNTDREFYF